MDLPKDRANKSATISATTLQRQIGTIIRRVAKENEHITVERDGFPVIVLISTKDYHLLMQDRQRLETIIHQSEQQPEPQPKNARFANPLHK